MGGVISEYGMANTEMRQHIPDIRHAQKSTGPEVTEVKREFALVEAPEPVPPPPQTAWDRAPDHTKMWIMS